MWTRLKLMVLWRLAAHTLIAACDAFESYQWFQQHGFYYEYLRDLQTQRVPRSTKMSLGT